MFEFLSKQKKLPIFFLNLKLTPMEKDLCALRKLISFIVQFEE